MSLQLVTRKPTRTVAVSISSIKSTATALRSGFSSTSQPLQQRSLNDNLTSSQAQLTVTRRAVGASSKRQIDLNQTTLRSMASDAEYMSFLDKANQDADEAHAAARSQGQAKFKTLDEGADVPKVIKDVCKDAVYVSEADEPFEEVSLNWTGDGGLPDEEEFAKLIKHWDAATADISILDPFDWDSNGQYTNVIDAVRQASRGNDVRVYRVVRDKTRVEYWVISRQEGRLVGVKALGVET